jgi:hypothetical protein
MQSVLRPRAILVLVALAVLQLGRLRAFEFFRLAHDGVLSWTFAGPAGVGDLVIGLTAPVVALGLWRRGPSSRTWALVWNVAGILDLAMAVTLGVLTDFPTELPLKVFPNVTAHLGIIPYFAVPACILAHAAGIAILCTERVSQYFAVPH